MVQSGAHCTAVVLDRDPLWQEAIHEVLAKLNVDVLASVGLPEEALLEIEQHRPDLLITEIVMPEPGRDGIPALRLALRRLPDLRIIVLSISADETLMRRAFLSGAFAYVIKTSWTDDFVASVRLAVNQLIHGRSANHASARPGESPQPAGPSLTPREREVLALVAEGLSNAELAKVLWVTEQTIKFHLSNIYRKLGVFNRTSASRWALTNGLAVQTTSSTARER